MTLLYESREFRRGVAMVLAVRGKVKFDAGDLQHTGWDENFGLRFWGIQQSLVTSMGAQASSIVIVLLLLLPLLLILLLLLIIILVVILIVPMLHSASTCHMSYALRQRALFP